MQISHLLGKHSNQAKGGAGLKALSLPFLWNLGHCAKRQVKAMGLEQQNKREPHSAS